MFENSIVQAVQAATVLLDEGEEEDVRALLTRTLLGCGYAADEVEAVAIVEATRLLIELDICRLPEGVLDTHVERMYRLTEGFDGDEVVAFRAETELCRFEWVHARDDAEDFDSIMLVDMLRAASSFVERGRGSANERVRRAAAEAEMTVQVIRGWLHQDPLTIVAALESLAARLATEAEDRMRHIRASALYRAAELRIEHDVDPGTAKHLLHLVIAEAAESPAARDLYFSATLLVADIALRSGEAPAVALREAFAALHGEPGADVKVGRDLWLRCQHLEELLNRLPADEQDRVAISEWNMLIDRYVKDQDPRVRASILKHVRHRNREVAEVTAADLQILQYADTAARQDNAVSTMDVRLQIAAQIIEVLGFPDPGGAPASAPRRNPAMAVQLSEDLDQRFPHSHTDPDLSVLLARLYVDRALRLSGIGRREEALSALSHVRARFSNAPKDRVRHLFAQASYWEGRLNREAGNWDAARRAVDRVVSEFANDPAWDVRVWAANALYSAWRDSTLGPDDAEAIFNRFAGLFSDDSDPRIRRHESSGRLSQAVRAHEQGNTSRAVSALECLIEAFEEESDADIVDTVRLARENLAVLSLTSPDATASTVEAESRYRALRERLTTADQHYESGNVAEAVQQWRAVVDETAGTPDPNLAILGLAALDQWGECLNETQQWPALIDVAQRAMITRGYLDFRAERMRARAYLRFGIAQSFIGDPHAALTAYETLDALIAPSTDDDLMTTRQQALYNRAVLIDDLGNAQAAIDAYDHVLAVHGASTDSKLRRLRRVKALRNKALLLDRLNRIVETAHTHRQILDIATGSLDPDLSSRARLSAFELAQCHSRLGDHATAAQTYAWIRSQPSLGFTKTDIRTATQAQKTADRENRRHKKTNRHR
ncbi:tetratricopeptide repeat protein [Arthrobacter sp. GMC3]|uniref:tetratricopeptide repeat protein n=1 Tax=Arthrobacter sp. GMC3 TaxID=2058894 RepID=UPI000CE4EFA8|nr:tetratricopeptide repeat protein [Arthrobacter sp. GMC3]